MNENTERVNENTERVNENTERVDENTERVDEDKERADDQAEPSRSVVGRIRDTEKYLAQFAPARMSMALPRAADFLARAWWDWWQGIDADHLPGPVGAVGVAAQAALDEAILLAVMAPSRFPRRDDYERVGAEMRAAGELAEREGWLDDPTACHREPPPLVKPLITLDQSLTGQAYERLSFHSGFEPHPEAPGRDRWHGYYPNQIAHAWVLRHGDGQPRPWIVCLHGFAMGYPTADFPSFRAGYLFEKLGYDLVFPVIPLHGPRRVSRMSGDAFLSFDLTNAILGLTQTVWDVRRILSWVRSQGATSIGLYGISLGGYCAALLAGIEDGIDTVLCGIPVTDLPSLFSGHSPPHVQERGEEHGILGVEAERAWKTVSPFSFKPKVPHERRFLYAARGDRIARPQQARDLWKHWGEPRAAWYDGNHVAYLLSTTVRAFVAEVFAGPEDAEPSSSSAEGESPS